MNILKRLWKNVQANPRLMIVVGVLLSLFLIISSLETQAALESNARKSLTVLQFESKSDEWLKHSVPVAQFRDALDNGKVSAVALVNGSPGMALFTLKDGTKASLSAPGCTILSCAGTVLEKIDERSVKDKFALVRVDVDTRTPARRLLDSIMALLMPLVTVGILVGAMYVVTRMSTGMGAGAKASKLQSKPSTVFVDVVGNQEAKAALRRVTAFMQDPSNYVKLGASAPRGVLMVGPPGTGKTLLAKALAGESKANFIAVDGSYFTSMYYGMGVNKVRDLFKLARDNAPCVLFIDEVDGIGRRSTGGSNSGGESEQNRIINRILVEMDGFDTTENVVVVAATNHENNLDEAMRRPGRFDMLVRMQMPTLPERKQLFDMYIEKITHDGKVDTQSLARMTQGMSPADIANMVNKAASSAAEQFADSVKTEHLLRAIETQQLGGEVSAIKDLLTEGTRRRLAYHEAGHAILGHALKTGVVERVTIEPRGPALGVTYITDEDEDPLEKSGDMASQIAMLLAGREAELLLFGDMSTGASNDLERATKTAIAMVGLYGFSKTFGLLSVKGVPPELLSSDIQHELLQEARLVLEQAQKVCQKVLTDRRHSLDALATALLEQEVVSGPSLNALLDMPAPSPTAETQVALLSAE